jgi:hypothetical protein
LPTVLLQTCSTSRHPQATDLSFNGSESGAPRTKSPQFPVTSQVTETDAPQGFVIDSIAVGSQPFGIAFNPENGLLYVTNGNSNNVSVIAPLNNIFERMQWHNRQCRPGSHLRHNQQLWEDLPRGFFVGHTLIGKSIGSITFLSNL